ncbi:ATP-binding protein [Pararobbsia silviterrae]|nr:ATP-binding protein [Pararobbsia silviterrae]
MASQTDTVLGRARVAALPTPLAIAIAEYEQDDKTEAGERVHLLKLWRACEAVELTLRVLVVLCIGELVSRNRWTPDVVDMLRDRIDRPTLGLWKSMLLDLIKVLPRDDTVLDELPGLAQDIAEFFDGTGPARGDQNTNMIASFSALRNRLAHGGGLTHEAAAMLLRKWEDPIDLFLARFLWLDKLTFYARSPQGALTLLRGQKPERTSEPVAQAPLPNDDEIVVARGGRSVVIWPLARYGMPWVANLDALPEDIVVEIYARRSSVEGFHYTPIGLDAAYWSSSRANASAKFLEMFPPQARDADRTGDDAVESFRREIGKDAKLFVGRQHVLSHVLDLVRSPPRIPLPLLWLSGSPGMGKSTLIAKVAHRLMSEHETFDAPLTIVPYRFKRGDARCSREYFFMLASRSLRRIQKSDDAADYKLETLQSALLSLAPGAQCVFILDGIDEIDDFDPAFLTEVCVKLARECAPRGNVTWLLSGRAESSNSSLTRKLRDAGAYDIFPDGLEPMHDEDIRAILLDQIGPARNVLIRNDTMSRTELGTLPLTQETIAILDTGVVPPDVRDAFAKSGIEFGEKVRCYPIREEGEGRGDGQGKQRDRGHDKGRHKGRKGKHSASWLLDEDGTMFCVERMPDRLAVCRYTTGSTFVDRVRQKSDGLPLYLRYVVLDILAGRLFKLDGRDPLPDKLTGYYQQLLKQHAIGTEYTLLTPVLCLIAVAKEPLSKEQLLMRIRGELSTSGDPEAWFETVILRLSSMLRGGRDVQAGGARIGSGYSLYHESLRQHLETDAATIDAVKRAREWVVGLARDSAFSLERAGPFAAYFARHGVTHLLEAGQLADAVALLNQLKVRTEWRHDVPRGYLSSVTSRKVGLALSHWLGQWASHELSDQERTQRDDVIKAMSPLALANIIFDTYETGIYSAVLRILIEFNYDVWWKPNRERIRDRFITSIDIVAKHTVGEALSDVFAAAGAPAQRDRLLADIKAMARSPNIDEREAAGYALQEIFLDEPELIDLDVIERWASSPTNIERMILGEFVVSFAHADPAALALHIANEPAWQPFFAPIWENNALDVDDFHVLMTPRAAHDRRVSDCANEHAATRAKLDRLLADPYIRADGDPDRPLVALLEGYDTLSAGDPIVRAAVPALHAALQEKKRETRRIVLDIIKVLFSHSFWAVAEAATSVVADLVHEDIDNLSLIDELLAEPDAYWRVRYGIVDAAFNVREFDGYQRLRRALRANFAHANARVRGICLDEFFAWVRLAEPSERLAILREFEQPLRAAIEHASDCWELEYLYLVFALLDRDGEDVGQWLGPDQRYARYFGDVARDPFYKLDRQAFLLRIDAIRMAELMNTKREACR